MLVVYAQVIRLGESRDHSEVLSSLLPYTDIPYRFRCCFPPSFSCESECRAS